MKAITHPKSVSNLCGLISLRQQAHGAIEAVQLKRKALLLGWLTVCTLALSLLNCTPQTQDQKQQDQKQQEPTTPSQTVQPDSAQVSDKALIERGEYLVNVGGCNDCHTPKMMTPTGVEPDTNHILAGHPQNITLPTVPNSSDWVLINQTATAFVGPWGISFAANLTPDDTGLGSWSFEQFETAMRKGKAKGIESNRSLLPLMPWQNYKDMKGEDLRALFAYLQSLKPVENLVPQPVSPEQLKN